MEQHPVPQNVTTFQFRLVGDMTIRQFGYLVGGIIVGYLCSKLPLPFFFTWPLAISSGLLGFGLAFVPVEERPMDVWIASFFKNIYSPTQWVWQKEKRVSIMPAAKPKQAALKPTPTLAPHIPQKTPSTATHAPPAHPAATGAILSAHRAGDPLGWLKSIFQGKPKSASPSLSPGFSFADALAAGPVLQKPAVPASPPAASQQNVAHPPPVVAPAPPAGGPQATVHDRAVELQGQLSEALQARERLEKELIAIRGRLEQQTKTGAPPPVRQASIAPTAPTGATSVRVIAPDAATKAGLPRLTTFPNVVTGIVKDHHGNLLAGMLITVRDRDDVPLRALKTNKLGQFAASTPLPNNTYVVEIEDPKGGFIFDKAQIALAGAVAPPIEVTAKSQKQVERDNLAKEIFGNQMQ